MSNDIIKKQWTAFRKLVVPANAPPIQVTEMRNAFYAGAQMIFNEIIRISAENSEDKAEYQLEQIEKEFEEFARKLTKKYSH